MIPKPQNVIVLGGSNVLPDDPMYKQAEFLGEHCGNAGISIITGGGAGIMEAANSGAMSNNGHSVGIALPSEIPNKFLSHMDSAASFSSRIDMFLSFSNSLFVVFPGSLGTLTEVFALLNANYMHLSLGQPALRIVLINARYWEPILSSIQTALITNKLINNQNWHTYPIHDNVSILIAKFL